MKFIPHRYQKYSIDFIIEVPRCGLILDMGLGKTVITLTAIQELMYDYFTVSKVLVIAPLRVAEFTWSDEVEKWEHLDLKISKVLGSPRQRQQALKEESDVYIINRENVVWLYEFLGKDFDFDMLVIDELSSFKNPNSKRFKALKKLAPYCSRFVGLTGTPSPNGYLDLWSQIYLLDQGERLGRTLGSYRNNYFTAGRRNGYIVYDWILKEGAEDLIQRKIEDVCISLQAKDWLDMPDKVNQNILIDMPKNVMVRYREFEKTNILEYEENKAILGTNAGAVTNKLLQFANGAIYDEDRNVVFMHDKKLEALEEIVEASQGKPVLVFYSYKHDLDRILKRFKNARTLNDANDFSDWNKRKIEMLICHPASMGHGLNMQDGGNIIVWFGLTWSLELYQQANARLHRQGQKQKVFIYHILAKDTHDGDVLKSLEGKNVNQQDLIESIKARIIK